MSAQPLQPERRRRIAPPSCNSHRTIINSNSITTRLLLLSASSSDEDYYNDDNDSDGNNTSNNSNNSNSMNEFSRPIRTQRVLHTTKKRRNNTHQEQQQQQRDYECHVKASPEECQALADRFELTDLTELEASLKIRPAISSGVLSSSSSAVVLPVEVEGTIQAHLTQTCVRTNEKFEVDVEFPLYALVKPMSSVEALMSGDGAAIMDDNYDYDSSGSKKAKNKNKKNNKKSSKAKLAQSTQQVYSLDDVMDLQAAIEAASADDDYDNDDGDGGMYGGRIAAASSSLVEDEAIYSSQTGVLDVGELVAQTFWLELDPFPKKPGTGPIEMEISG